MFVQFIFKDKVKSIIFVYDVVYGHANNKRLNNYKKKGQYL